MLWFSRHFWQRLQPQASKKSLQNMQPRLHASYNKLLQVTCRETSSLSVVTSLMVVRLALSLASPLDCQKSS